MAAVEDELDFSSYLVDIDDDGVLPSATDTTNAAFAASMFPPSTAFSPPSITSSAAGRPFQAVQTHSAKNWPAGIIQQHQPIGFISPSPTESTSESSYKASTNSTAGTAPSSIASSSQPDSGSSWRTQKTFVNPKKAHALALSTSTPSLSGTTLEHSSGTAGSRKTSSISIPTDTTPPASAVAVSAATHKSALSSSFSYDFAHNPAHDTALSPPHSTVQAHSSTSGFHNDALHPAQYSASLPSNSRPGDFPSKHGSWDKVNSEDSHSALGKPMSPSSGPQHVSKGHRNRQPSASSAALSTSLGSSGLSPHWLSMTPSAQSNAIPQFASTPYSRPVPPSNDNSSLTSAYAQNFASGNGLSKKPSKRKATSTNASVSIPQVQAEYENHQTYQAQPGSQPIQNQQHQYAFAAATNVQATNAPGLRQFGFPIPTPTYREPASVIASPISPSLDSFPSFANFMSQTGPSSTAPSPANQPSASYTSASKPNSKNGSSVTTPNDVILSAVTAPSPFDPRNFGSFNLDPLSDNFTSQLANLATSSSQPPVSTAASQAALEVSRAAALAGVGSKWMNWSNSQGGNPEVDAAFISNILATPPDIATTASRKSSEGAKHISEKSRTKSSAPFDPFHTSETSVVSSKFDDIDGESPEDLAARDPLATHLWRLYAKAKAGLPNGARMENITWRMMGLKLNKQKADAIAAGRDPVSLQPKPVSGNKDEKIVQEQVEERGRRGRSTAANSASPGESGDFAEMDWRQQSRSRSRVPQAIAGGMDWRAQSRSRSRAPGMRLSMPSGPQGFHLPTYADIVETMASVSRAPQDVSSATSTGVPQNVEPSPTAFGNDFRQASQNQVDLQSIERTLKQYMKRGEIANDNDRNGVPTRQNDLGVPTPNTQAQRSDSSTLPPVPLPISANDWMNGMIAGQHNDEQLSTSMPQFSQIYSQHEAQPGHKPSGSGDLPANTPPDPRGSIDIANTVLQSPKSISASVEAYLSSLKHTASAIDLPPHRHVGSIPGLFNEQELKANQHADYGFLPKLVRKTSFDASYPAQLAQENQKLSQKKRSLQQQPQRSEGTQQQLQHEQAASMPAAQASVDNREPQQLSQSWTESNNMFSMDNINNYLRSAAHSVPTTPSITAANIPYDLFATQLHVPSTVPFAPYTGEISDINRQTQMLVQAQAQAQAQTATIEAFRRLQTAQALQAALQQQQQQRDYAQYQMETAYSTGSLPPEILAAISSGQYAHLGMQINPLQAQYMQYGSNALPNFAEPSGSSWSASPRGNQTAPTSQYASPEEQAATTEVDRLCSATTSRSSSFSNIPSLSAHGFARAGETQEPSAHNVDPQSGHGVHQSTTVPTSNIEDGGAATVCVNCKTTNTPLWRRDENGQPLCNACQLFRKLHGSDRPVSLHNSVVKKRNRTRNKEAPKKSTSRSQRLATNNTPTTASRSEDATPEDA